jgi:hypothetical protein
MKTYRVINTENDGQELHEYDILVGTNEEGHQVTTLRRSLDGNWSEHARGEEVIKLIDTGNEVIFPKKMFSEKVEYDIFAELHIIMSFLSNTSYLPTYKGRVEEVTNKVFEI